jgi:hypothetical protein
MALCSDPSCRRRAEVKGLCLGHYNRIQRGTKITGRIRSQEHRVAAPGTPRPGESACTIMDCGRKVAAMGMCWGHYRRHLEGKPVFVTLATRDGAKRVSVVRAGPKNAPYRVRRLALFAWWLREGLVTPEPTTGCLLWCGEYNEVVGYGRVGTCLDPWGGYAHRAALHFSGVRLRKGRDFHVRHKCNQPGCVNVEHLSYDRAWLNMRDRSDRYGGQTMTPETAAQVKRALLNGELPADAARRFGVAYSTVYAIHIGRSWRWVAPVPNPQQGAA